MDSHRQFLGLPFVHHRGTLAKTHAERVTIHAWPLLLKLLLEGGPFAEGHSEGVPVQHLRSTSNQLIQLRIWLSALTSGEDDTNSDECKQYKHWQLWKFMAKKS